MTEDSTEKFNLQIPRRKYYSINCGLTSCPECGSPLVEEGCTIILAIRSDTDEANCLSNLNGSRFCKSCPVVVFDSSLLDQAAKLGIGGGENIRHLITGIVNLDSIPKEKRHLPIGSDDNPAPMIRFLPNLKNSSTVRNRRIGRNEPCPCGSGKKYKKCCE